MEEMNIKIYIVDDHPVVIEGIKALLDSVAEFEVVSSATDGESLLAKLELSLPDVILMDINLPEISGIDLCKEVIAKHSDIKVIGLSTYNTPSMIMDMLGAGAMGYLLKNADKSEIELAIKSVYNGKRYLSREVQSLLAEVKINDIAAPNLTQREKQIIRLLADGLTTNQIAERLFISYLTAETHRKNILRKFNVNNTASMIKQATQLRLI